MFSTGILGMNARNLSFIKKYNDTTAILLADNKLKTKKYFSQMGVPFARTYKEILNFEELKHFSFSEISEQNFVIKPNKGSKGRGIYILERREGLYFSEGKEISEQELFHHMRDILDGAYSISGFRDTIIIEERLIPHHDFQPFCSYGLADIRVIVFNYVPIAAMVRLPTLSSAGKANLNQGGIGMGIDIGTGKVTTLLFEGKIYTQDFPEKYQDFFQRKIPDWEKILHLSSQIQGFVDLGYLALDWIVSFDTPKLLEINARAGLEIQNVTGIPLKARMERIKNMKIADAQKGISLAKSLFSTENHPLIDTSNSLYLSQLGALHYTQDGKNKIIPVTIKVDTNISHTRFSQDIYELFQTPGAVLSVDGCTISFQKLKGEVIPEKHIRAECILAARDIQNYVIKPIHRYQAIEQYFDPGLLTPMVKDIDVRINEVSKYLNLSYHLEATNFEIQMQKFIEAQGRYNPVFEYRFPERERLDWIADRLKQVQDDFKKITSQSGLHFLFEEKLQELWCKWNLLKAYASQDFENIYRFQKQLYGEVQQKYLEIADKKLQEQKSLPSKSDILGRVMGEEEIIIKIQEKLIFYGLPETQITVRSDMTARISVTTGQFARINIKQGVKIYEKELDAVLAHELGVHMRRFINGSKSGLRLLKHGTGFYLEDEEGLAIYHSLRYLPVNYEKNDMYIKYALCEQAHRYSFQDLAERLKDIYGERTLEAQFLGALRLKKGIIDTSQFGEQGLSYTKDSIYLNGYMKVKKWVEEGGYIENLMVGKIKIQDIENFIDS